MIWRSGSGNSALSLLLLTFGGHSDCAGQILAPRRRQFPRQEFHRRYREESKAWPEGAGVAGVDHVERGHKTLNRRFNP
jgi:hypothetical protein